MIGTATQFAQLFLKNGHC